MGKLNATGVHLASLEGALRRHEDLAHLRTRRYGDLLILESGPQGDAIPHARFRRATVQWWHLELADHRGKWERTPYRDGIPELLELLRESFPWVLAPIENPEGN